MGRVSSDLDMVLREWLRDRSLIPLPLIAPVPIFLEPIVIPTVQNAKGYYRGQTCCCTTDESGWKIFLPYGFAGEGD
ncbi:hypothetical protein GCM10027402_17840 [Arthrobacter monumenti]